ncbi:MAG: hypothetical protein R2755_28095 [Acidimicrobiales bacterium]
MTVVLDFEGSMVPGIARFFAGFPGVPSPIPTCNVGPGRRSPPSPPRGGLAEARRLLGDAHGRSL